MPKKVLPPTAAFSLMLLLSGAVARSQEPVWAVRVYAVWPRISGEHDLGLDRRGKFEGKPGEGLVIEVRPTPRIGIELAGVVSKLEIRSFFVPPASQFEFREDGRLVVTTVGLAVHPFLGRAADLSIGPVAGYIIFERSAEAHTNTAFGGALTLDWPLGGRGWALSGTARYLAGHISLDFSGDARLPMWFVGAGVSYRR